MEEDIKKFHLFLQALGYKLERPGDGGTVKYKPAIDLVKYTELLSFFVDNSLDVESKSFD